MSIITLTTDFGIKDHFAGTVKGALLSEINEAEIISNKQQKDKGTSIGNSDSQNEDSEQTSENPKLNEKTNTQSPPNDQNTSSRIEKKENRFDPSIQELNNEDVPKNQNTTKNVPD